MADHAQASGAAPKWAPVISIASRALVGGVFLYAGLIKVANHQQEIVAIDAYKMLPSSIVPAAAAALPAVEIAVSVFLLLGIFVRYGAILAATLAIVFTIAMAQAKARGLAIDCGCFTAGGTGNGVGWLDILKDLPIVAGALYLAWRPAGPFQLDGVLFEGTDE